MNSAHNQLPQTATALVVGLGLTGWSVVRYLAERDFDVTVTDTREDPPFLERLKSDYPGIAFIHNLQSQSFGRYDHVVASPGIAVAQNNVIGDIELFASAANAPIIAITGSNGKSTVTMLVGDVLRAGGYEVAVGGNIGTPALDLLNQPQPDFYVLELSSFQLDTTSSLQPAAATVLNVSEDHLDRYSSVAQYAQSKRSIYNRTATAVWNRQDQQTQATHYPCQSISFGLDAPEDKQFGVLELDGTRFIAHGETRLAMVSDMTMGGDQNVANILAAFALISANGIALTDAMVEAAMSYPGLPHRCEMVGEWNGVGWINDSKGTNVGATLAAIRGTQKPLVLIAGGQGKGADFSPLANAMNESVRAVLLFGEDAEKLQRVLEGKVSVYRVVDLSKAIQLAKTIVHSGDTVLFSPACASFDMFNSYVERGETFRRLVQEAHDAA